MEAFKNAPPRAKQVQRFGGALSVVLLVGYCASAAIGETEWGKALALGALRLALVWGVASAVRSGNKLAWSALLLVVGFRIWKGLRHTWEMSMILMRDGFEDQGQAIAFGAIGIANWTIGGILLWLLLSKEVREYVHLKVPEPA